MKKFFNRLLTAMAFLAIPAMIITYTHPDWVVDPVLPKVFAAAIGQCSGYPDGICESCTIGQCGGKDASPPDPNRPYFDACGNEYDYMGNLIKQGTGCQQPTPAPTTTYTPPADQTFEGK